MKKLFNTPKIIATCFILVLLLVIPISWANEIDSTPSATPQIDEEKIKALKEKLATKVAEIRETQTRGYFGEIAGLSKTSFTLVTTKGEVKVRFSEDTKLVKLDGKKVEIEAKDLANALSATLLGLFDPETDQLNAKVILLQSQPKHLYGEITAIDKEDTILTLRRNEGDPVELVYEKTTSSQEYDPNKKSLSKSGFSRIAVGDRLETWVKPSEDDTQKMSLMRVLRLPKALFESTAEPGSSPKVSASPSATLKVSPKSSPKPTPQASS